MKTILVPTDFSPHSDKALDQALELAKLAGASIHLLHCYQLHPGGISPYGITVPAEFDEKIRDAAAKGLAAVEQRLEGQGVEVVSHITPSYPAEAVSELAKEIDADLIVMGTRGATGLQHILLGSVAERTLRMAPCPVLTVKASDD